ncbi:MAG: lipoate--protein ligase [Christensenellales bacterium]|jgi:lipoate-protein ligase A
MKTLYIETACTDPHRNLALEELLLRDLPPDSVCLYLWQNQNTVVIGRHQNPWRECRVQLMEQEGAILARRLSGGGAVYHDLGNLNFTFVSDRRHYDLHRQLGVVLSAVRSLSIPAEFTGRNDLTADGGKFSGNAFCFRERTAFHHGTLLLSADIGKMGRYLQVSSEKMQSKGIDSVRARVVNLTEFNPAITVDTMKQALKTAFDIEYGGPLELLTETDAADPGELERIARRNASWEWRFGHTPRFDIELDNRFVWGGVTLALTVRDGRVQAAACWSDAMDEAFISSIAPALTGVPFSPASLAEAVAALQGAEAADLAAWLREKDF